MNTIKKGSKGDDVKLLQRLLQITDDGVFGSQTEAIVKIWQHSQKLVQDGIVGPKSWQKLTELFSAAPFVKYNPLVVHITKSRNRTIKYIALHYTAGAKSTHGTANAVKSVFQITRHSADFAVDDQDIVQFNPDIMNNYTWAVGDNKNSSSGGASLYGICSNSNSISVEMCSSLRNGWSAKYPNHNGWYITDKTLENAKKLVKALMRKYNIRIENVVRHYDVSGKLCPGVVGWNKGFIYNNSGKSTLARNDDNIWLDFKKELI